MGYRSRLKNLIRIQGIPKLVELAIISILAMVTRFGGPDGKDLVLGDDPENSDAFGHMIVYGYFLIIIVQIIGVVLEEDYNFQNLIYTVLGSLFFLCMGIAQIASTASYANNDANDDILKQQSNRYAHGSLSIVQSLVMLIDAGVQVYKYKEERI